MLEHEVFLPIGIHYAPINRTIEPGGRSGQPLMAYGYYPTIADMVKIARLYQSGGRHGGTQILYGPRIRSILAAKAPIGLPTGTKTRFGETYYYNAFWMNAYRDGGRCSFQYPVMVGWGGNLVALLPEGSIAIRLAKSPNDDDRSGDPSDLAIVANRLDPFCP
jgi:CubicO group peptidase (beta-lactamase class C family)